MVRSSGNSGSIQKRRRQLRFWPVLAGRLLFILVIHAAILLLRFHSAVADRFVLRLFFSRAAVFFLLLFFVITNYNIDINTLYVFFLFRVMFRFVCSFVT